MGYLFLNDGSADGRRVIDGSHEPQTPDRSSKGLSPLEWSVVALARHDRLSSLRTPGRWATVLHGLFSVRQNPCLADPKLEVLRRIAVLGWRRRLTSHGDALKAFTEAGFDIDQYDLLIDTLGQVAANSAMPHRK